MTPPASHPIILAGGLGTRLAGVLPNLPKTLAPVGGRPFITFLLDQLVDAGFEQVTLCIGYKADQVRAALGAIYRTLAIRYCEERELLGTGGAIRLAAETISAPRYLVLNGDSYCRASLRAFLQWQEGRAEPVGMIVVQVANAERYGRVDVDASQRVRKFREKDGVRIPGLINAGVYSIPAALVGQIALDRPFSLEREAFPEWLDFGIAAYHSMGPFIDIGTPESFRGATAWFESLLGAPTTSP